MMYILKYLGDVYRYCSLLWNALEIRWIDRWIEAWIDGEECDRVTVAIVNGGVRAVGIWVLAVQFFQLCCWLKIFTIKCWEKKIDPPPMHDWASNSGWLAFWLQSACRCPKPAVQFLPQSLKSWHHSGGAKEKQLPRPLKQSIWPGLGSGQGLHCRA